MTTQTGDAMATTKRSEAKRVTRFTPGPWEHVAQANVIRSTRAGFVADANNMTIADARLISQAPAMADALRAYVAWQLGKGKRPNIEDARAILAAIDGSES
jgi:hypothetical protein